MKRAFPIFLLVLFSTVPVSPQAVAQWADRSPHKSGFVTVNGVKLHYLDWGGKGETLLFLHGLGDSAHIFDDIAPKFTDHFRVLALTRRGHGLSDKPQTGYETSTLVEDIRQFLDALKIKRVSLVGHSMADKEMTLFAGLYPGWLRFRLKTRSRRRARRKKIWLRTMHTGAGGRSTGVSGQTRSNPTCAKRRSRPTGRLSLP
jgi:hypothetical protein